MAKGLTYKQAQDLFVYSDGKLIWKNCKAKIRSNGDRAGSLTNLGYREVGVGDVRYLEHRIVWLYHKGEMPKESIDHINGVKDDNRIENLRDVSQRVNSSNQKKSKLNSSGYCGVHYSKNRGKWVAKIKVSYQHITLGYFLDRDDAASCRYAAQIALGFSPNHGGY